MARAELAFRVVPSRQKQATEFEQHGVERGDPWSDRGTFSEALQELKLLWHVLVRYGNIVPL